MSVLFTSVSDTNPVTTADVHATLAKLNLTCPPGDETDFTKLLAAIHDIATLIDAQPDYEPPTDLTRFPRRNVSRKLFLAANQDKADASSKEGQVLGAAWAHTFSIKDEAPTSSTPGPLAGKTVCLKDCIAVAQVPQLLGTNIVSPWTPGFDATVVTRALLAGAEIVGTANCENWCQSTSSFSSTFGTVENPFAKGYSAGGSTSGAAALVGGGVVDIGIGADQGGSIRVPASLCGCVGLKPTHGLIPYTGFASNDAINDHAGPLTRNVLDAALTLDALAGYDGIDDRSLGAPKPGTTTFAADLLSMSQLPLPQMLSGFKIGILHEAFAPEHQPLLDPATRTMILDAASKFTQLGATVTTISIPEHLLGTAIWTIEQRISGYLTLQGLSHGRRGHSLTQLEAAKNLPWSQTQFEKEFFPTTQNVLLNGAYLLDKFPGALYSKSVNLGRKLRDAYEAVFAPASAPPASTMITETATTTPPSGFDALILPTTSFPAPKHGTRTTPLATIAPTVGLTSNTTMFDTTGHPAMSLPIGFVPAREDKAVMLPVGMQIVGALGEDGKVLKAGWAWEKAFDWKQIKGTRE